MRHFILSLLLILGTPIAFGKAPEPGSDVVAELFPQYHGKYVRKISIEGLKRSRESTVRWMLGVREGQYFDEQAWQTGVEHLYKTESIFDIHSKFTQLSDGSIEILVTLEDKWTLFPYVDFQGGGGSVSFSAGLMDTNLFGNFTNIYVGGGYLDKEYSYEVGISQRWFMQTHFSAAFDIAKHVIPVSMQNSAGTTQSTFTWKRFSQMLTIGKQNGERFYWEIKTELYKDSVLDPNVRTLGFVLPEAQQYRITPMVRFWKVSHSDYLEQGHELALELAEANPTQATRDYHSLTASWKQVFFLPDTKNIAYFLNAGHATASPLAYQFRLGGFDSVRGFSMNRIFGEDFARGNFEYRSTFLVHHFDFLEIGKMVLQSCFFTDVATMWNAAGINPTSGLLTQGDTRFLYSAGTGIRAIFLHFAGATARLDVAKAIVPQEGYNIAFGIGQFF